MQLKVQKLMLWMNSGCNARCGTCDIWKEHAGQMLSLAQIQTWIPEWRAQGLGTVVICGEGLMHPEIWLIAAALRSAGIRVELLSNGLLLRNHVEQVVAHCNVLRVSLDGPPALHDESRGVRGAFSKLADGVSALREIAPHYDLCGRCAIHRGNFRHLPDTVRTARSIGLSSISFSATDVHNEEAFRRFGRIDDEYVRRFLIGGALISQLEDEINRLFSECAREFASGFVSDTPDFFRQQVLGYYASLASQESKRSIRCNSPWTSAVLDYDGTIRPCFPMPGYGSIGEFGGLGAAINSEEAHRIRAGLDVTQNETCLRCVDQTFNQA